MHEYIERNMAERTFLVGIERKDTREYWGIEESLEELAFLAKTAKMEVHGQMFQRMEKPHPAHYIGPGKIEELVRQVEDLEIDTVIFDDELTPTQQRNLEKILGEEVKLLDRTALILDIFASRAMTREGQLQVELAQYEYRLPRLTRMWTHLARQAGGRTGGKTGGVGLRGPGETQLETDKRQIRKKIAGLKKKLETVSLHRQSQVQKRKKQQIPVINLVGYTNAGKSTLLKALSGSEIYADDMLFATLDPTTRKINLPSGQEALITDTVGFIKKIPHELIAAFKATLEGIKNADLLIHVVDISHPMAELQIKAVNNVLEEIGAKDKPFITLWNKTDKLEILPRGEDVIKISALKKTGLDNLLDRVEEILKEQKKILELEIPYTEGKLLNTIYLQGTVLESRNGEKGTHLKAWVPPQLAGQLRSFIIRH